jgi:hypothetical protein
MDHAEAVRLNATERFLLNELDQTQLEQFEEHMFACQECALDVQSASMFLEHTKNILAEPKPQPVPTPLPTRSPNPWLAWLLRPAIAVPVMAGLLVIVLFQNLVTYPHFEAALHQPQIMPWTAVNVGTWGAGGPTITAKQGQSFLLFVRIPPESGFERYTADLYNPNEKLEWSLTFPAIAGQDQWPMQVPGSQREPGTYTLKVRGITAAGETKDLGRTSFDLQIVK